MKPGHHFFNAFKYISQIKHTQRKSPHSPDVPGVVGAAVEATQGLELLVHWPLQQVRPVAHGPFFLKQSNVNEIIN